MNLQEFKNFYYWKRVDKYWNDKWKKVYYYVNDKNWNPTIDCWYHQCASLINVYCREVFKVEIGIFNKGAMDGFKRNSTFPSSKFEYIDHHSGFIPNEWDIVFIQRDQSNYWYWHIGIIISANNNSFEILEQNGGVWRWYGEKWDQITIRTKTYDKVAWYHRFKWFISSPQIQPNFNIWNEERPYDNVTKEEMDDMIVKAFGLNVDYYTIFNKYWKDLVRDPNATRVDYCTRAGRGNNTLTFENFGYKFDRITIAKFIINIQTLWTGVELPIATESEVREIFYKYFPNQNPSDVFRRYFPEIQETNNFLFDIRRAWYQSNKIKNEFKHDRFYILSCILDMKKKLG